MTALFPGTQCGIGPPIDEGFFYDFVVDRPFVPEDLERIEAKMRELAGAGSASTSGNVAARRGDRLFRQARRAAQSAVDRGEDGRPVASLLYTIKDRDTFVDFCVGPHVPSTSKLKAFKLLSTSNAYWKGDAKNPPMQRIYGTAFFSQKELDEHLKRIEEAKKRDHRQARQGARPVHVPSLGAGRHVLARERDDALQHARQLHARRAHSRPATSK